MHLIKSVLGISNSKPTGFQKCLQEFSNFDPDQFMCNYLLSLPLNELKDRCKAEALATEAMSKKIKSMSEKCRKAWAQERLKNEAQKRGKNRLSTIEEGKGTTPD